MSSYSKRAQALLAILGDRPIAYHPKLAGPLGGPMEVIFVCQLLYWDEKGQTPGGWIYKSQEEWQQETGLTRRNQETVRKHLGKDGLGVIEEKLSGMPARLYYRLDFAKLIPLIEEAYGLNQDDTSLVCTNPPNKIGATRQASEDESANQDCADQPDLFGATRQRSEITSETSSEISAKDIDALPRPLPDLIDLIPDFSAPDRVAFLAAYPHDDAIQWLAYVLDPNLPKPITNPAAYLNSCCIQKHDSPPAHYAEHEINRIVAARRVMSRRDAHRGGARRDGERDATPVIVEVQPPPIKTIPRATADPQAVEVWSQAMPELEAQMTGATFGQWIKPARPLRIDSDGRFIIAVDTIYAQEWLAKRLYKPIQRILSALLNRHIEPVFTVVDQIERNAA